MNTKINRRKTAMVLHDIEIALGDFALELKLSPDELPTTIVDTIIKRDSNLQEKELVTQNIIEATYLDELFSILLDASKNTSLYQDIVYIKNLFILYEIYNIRNIISHPNRIFIDCYWYKTAALASNPIFEKLNLSNVKKALYSAEKEELIDPPDEWIKQIIWKIPNNIPEKFEHSITGLIGRTEEKSEIIKNLKNPRINSVTVVAPGGIGKTALLLDILHDLVHTPEIKDYFDGCLFLTLKTEKLTENGIQKLDNAQTFDELKNEILDEVSALFDLEIADFDELYMHLSSKKLLLCIDNLETLLMEDEQSFNKFNVSLPPSFKLLITSRISINNSFIVNLGPLSIKLAQHLAREYLKRRGGKTLPEEQLSMLVSTCYCNPLAIRLSIDLFISGNDIKYAVNIAHKEIVNFSFNNLIDSLPNNSIKILEALLIEPTCDRLSLGEILNLSAEEISDGISRLANTSLITRQTKSNGEIFALSQSIKDFIITSIKNIPIRQEIYSEISKRKALAKQHETDQKNNNFSKNHFGYIDDSLHDNLKLLLISLRKILKKKDKLRNSELINLLNKFKQNEQYYDEIAAYHIGYGRVYSELGTHQMAIKEYQKALSLEPELAMNKYLLANALLLSSKYQEAEELFNDILDKNLNEDLIAENKNLINSIYIGYYQSLLYNHKYNEILEKTKEWNKNKNFKEIIGSYRAIAWKRKAEQYANSNPDECIKLLTSSIKIMDDILRNGGYNKTSSLHSKNIFNEIAYCLNNINYSPYNDFKSLALTFILKRLPETTDWVSYTDDDSNLLRKLIYKLISSKETKNPFDTNFWHGFCDYDNVSIISEQDIQKNNLVKVTVSRRPTANSYLFAKDDQQKDYYIHYEQFKCGDWSIWKSIRERDILAVKPSKISQGSNINVDAVYLTNND